jgi:DNA-binding NarL/FixJ family response regulator
LSFNTAIGKALGISERTARNHVSAILSKLGLKPFHAHPSIVAFTPWEKVRTPAATRS